MPGVVNAAVSRINAAEAGALPESTDVATPGNPRTARLNAGEPPVASIEIGIGEGAEPIVYEIWMARGEMPTPRACPAALSIVTRYGLLTNFDALSISVVLMTNTPGEVGVPESTPELLSVTPVGRSDGTDNRNVYGAIPPAGRSVAE